MKKLFLLSLILSAPMVIGAAEKKDLTELVNTFQGSYNVSEFSHGRCTPTVLTPHGMVSWSPANFSIVNNTVAGVRGSASLTPVTSVAALSDRISYGFDEKTAIGHPDYLYMKYSNGIVMEIAPTDRGGAVRFTFPKKEDAILAIAGGRGEGPEINLEKGIVNGHSQSANARTGAISHTYYTLKFNQPILNSGKTENGMIYFQFPKGAVIEVYSATSKISAAQAQVTFNREIAYKTFDQIRTEANAAWNKALGRIEIEGGTLEQQKTFYSCLYRTNMRPAINYEYDSYGNPIHIYNDVEYQGKYYTNPILWDAFRCLFALNNIIDTQLEKEYMPSLVKFKEYTGWWPSAYTMIGNHAITVFADAWAKGIATFDPKHVLDLYYDEITHSLLEDRIDSKYNIEHIRGYGRMGHEDYFALGYIPFPQETNRVIESTSKTLEYNYDDFCAYKLAKMTGNQFYTDLFAKHIYNYRNVFDKKDYFFKGRDVTGEFDKDFNPYEWGGPLVEGNAWQWRFFAPQDANGLIDLMDGEENFIKCLDEVFEAPADSALELFGGYHFRIHEINEAAAGKQGQYAQSNEPCFHMIHMYSYVGQPWKTQKILRDSMTRLFNSGPKGFPGDEDGGAMSAWYVLNAMGFYPVTPGVPEYVLGSPLFSKITIHLESGKDFVIKADNNKEENVYIQSAALNGANYTKCFITHKDIMNGGEILFKMSNTPEKTRGTALSDRPYSLTPTDANFK